MFSQLVAVVSPQHHDGAVSQAQDGEFVKQNADKVGGITDGSIISSTQLLHLITVNDQIRSDCINGIHVCIVCGLIRLEPFVLAGLH